MSQMRERITETFDGWADTYEDAMRRAQYFAPEWIKKHVFDLDDEVDCRVLDMACGTGINIKVLSEVRGRIRADGIDVSPKMVELAGRTNLYEGLHVHDLNETVPYIAEGTYDLVVAFGFVEMLSRADTFLSECRRVLIVGGTLWVSFRSFDTGGRLSPPRKMSIDGIDVTAYSGDEVLSMLGSQKLQVTSLDTVVGYVTSAGFPCPFHVVSARKCL